MVYVTTDLDHAYIRKQLFYQNIWCFCPSMSNLVLSSRPCIHHAQLG